MGDAMFCEDDLERADWPLLQNGAVNLFHKKSVFEETAKQLTDLGYHVAHIRCKTPEEFKTDISTELDWDGQFGYKDWDGNLDALNDGLSSPPMNEKNY